MHDPTLPAHPTAIDLFDSYRRDHDAALEPCVDCLMARCPDGEREALDLLLEDYFTSTYKRPPYSPVQMRRLREKIDPIIDRAMNDPSVIAANDQMQAAWRDRPWIVKRYRRARFTLLCWRYRLTARFQDKPWE